MLEEFKKCVAEFIALKEGRTKANIFAIVHHDTHLAMRRQGVKFDMAKSTYMYDGVAIVSFPLLDKGVMCLVEMFDFHQLQPELTTIS